MKLFYCLLLLLCPCLAPAQALQVGDTISEASLQQIMNAPAFNPILTPIGNKAILLDFMATTCSSCLEALPKLQALQQQFEKELQIVLVTSQSAEKIRNFLQKNTVGKKIKLPVIHGDSLLKPLFPHRYISHLAWINATGRVSAITGSDYINTGHVAQLVAGKPVNWPVKKDLPDFDYSRPLVEYNAAIYEAGTKPGYLYYSVLLPYLPEVRSRYSRTTDSLQATTRTSIINMPVVEAYLRLYRKPRFPKSRVVLQVSDSGRYIPMPSAAGGQDWPAGHDFCFEAQLPAAMPAEKQVEKLVADLGFYTHTSARWESRTINCLVIQKSDAVVAGKGPAAEEGLSIGNIVYELNAAYTGVPVLIEAKGAGTVRIAITADQLPDRELLKKALAEKGYLLLPATRKLDLLLVTETNPF